MEVQLQRASTATDTIAFHTVQFPHIFFLASPTAPPGPKIQSSDFYSNMISTWNGESFNSKINFSLLKGKPIFKNIAPGSDYTLQRFSHKWKEEGNRNTDSVTLLSVVDGSDDIPSSEVFVCVASRVRTWESAKLFTTIFMFYNISSSFSY